MLYIDERKLFIRCIQILVKTISTNFGYYLLSEQVNWCQGDGFSSVDAQMVPLNSQWLVLIGGIYI